MPSLAMLGGFQLTVDGEQVLLARSAERLLALVALEGRPRIRLYFASRLWPDGTEERSGANLRSALWRLRRAGLPLIRADAGRLSLHEQVEVDVTRLHGQAERLVGGGDCRPGDLDAGPLFHDLLPDWYDDWVLIEQERVRHMRLRALEALSGRLARAGRFAEAADAALASVWIEPLRESGHRALIAVHLAEGNRGEAVRQYERMRRLLRDEIGIEPAFAIEDLSRR
jgi:DNA-binding SARP family transcriptional activator